MYHKYQANKKSPHPLFFNILLNIYRPKCAPPPPPPSPKHKYLNCVTPFQKHTHRIHTVADRFITVNMTHYYDFNQ